MWAALQLCVVAAVLCGNIYWQWTPNGFLASAMAFGAAYGLTVAITWLVDRLSVHWTRQRGLQ